MTTLHKVSTDVVVLKDEDDREEAFGSNKKDPVELETFCQLLLGALNDFTLKILMVACALSFIIAVIFIFFIFFIYRWHFAQKKAHVLLHGLRVLPFSSLSQ